MKSKRKVRKPRILRTRPGGDLYAGIEKNASSPQHIIYIGGSYYSSSAQIHLQVYEARKLHAWLGKAILYLTETQRKGRGK